MNRWMRQSAVFSKAFTLIELLIVVVVIGILATIGIVGYGAVQGSAHDSSVKADLQKIDDAFKLYALDNEGIFPSSEATLNPLGIKLNPSSYNTTNKANVYVCVNSDFTEYAVVAMSKSGRRFVVMSESGISDYNGSIVWNSTTGNWTETCADINPTYTSPGSLSGIVDQTWKTWAHALDNGSFITNLMDNPSLGVNYTNWERHATYTGTVRVQYNGEWMVRGQRGGTAAGAIYIGKTTPLVVQSGQVYTGSATVISTVDATFSFQLRVGGGSTVIVSQDYSVTANQPTRMSVSGSTASTSLHLAVLSSSGTIGDVIYVTDAMLTKGSTLYNFADGSSPNWSWNGTAENSSSTGPQL